MALAALGLTEASVHEPVHDHHSERLTSITKRYHLPHDIRSIRLRLFGSRRPAVAHDSWRPGLLSPPTELRITSVFSRVARGFKGRLASFPQGAAGGSRWLLMAVRGHLGDMHRQCAGQTLSGLALPDDRSCSGQACRGA
jgi:hypothetical protein